MTVTSAMIAQVSEYTVAETGSGFTPAIFDYLSPVAKSMLDMENPGLPDIVYDHCHALLIAHLYAVKKGQTGYIQTSADGYSVRRKEGETSYLIEYRKILQTYSGSHSSSSDDSDLQESVIRADAVMKDFQLDQAEMPIFFSEVD